MIEYERLPLKALTDEEEQKLNTIEGVVKFNRRSVIEENKKNNAWSPSFVQKQIDDKLNGEPVHEVLFDGVMCSSGVMNELLDLTLQ